MAAKAGTSKYSTNSLAKKAVTNLTSATLAPLNKYDDLNSYVTENDTLRKDYAGYMDYGSVLDKYNAASDAAWDLARAEQIQAMNAAERSNYANTKAGVANIRNALAGSAASGANRGAANATALQALLGLGQQNSEATTQGMQGYQNAAREAAAARAQNAVSALDFNKSATDAMYSAATSAYGSDKEALGQAAYGAGQGLGQVGAAIDSNASGERMNNATNKTNASIANTASVSKNYNYNRK